MLKRVTTVRNEASGEARSFGGCWISRTYAFCTMSSASDIDPRYRYAARSKGPRCESIAVAEIKLPCAMSDTVTSSATPLWLARSKRRAIAS